MSYKIHKVGWVGLEGRAGGCMAWSRSRKLLAVSRSDNSIEIWNFSSNNSVPVLERCIPAQATEGSVEALAFAGPVPKRSTSDSEGNSNSSSEESDAEQTSKKKQNKKKRRNSFKGKYQPCEDTRLFSTGLHGLVIEHDLDHVDSPAGTGEGANQNRQRVWAVTSGPAWCMKFNRRSGRLAVGTEEGYVCLYSVVDDGLDFVKVLDKQEGRIFCLDWHTDGARIVTGSADTLRTWDVTSGLPLCRMSTGRTEKHRETVVWSVALLDDMTVVSGDSRGKTCFWNGRTGTLTDGYQTHRADVLSVCVNQNQSEVYSSGVDPVIFHFSPVASGPINLKSASNSHQSPKPNRGRKWVKSIHRFSHTHDVRAILCLERAPGGGSKKIVSIGVDSNLTVYDCQSKSLVKHPPIPHGRGYVISPKARLVTVKQNDTLDVWRMGETTAAASNGLTGYLPVMVDPVKWLTLKMTSPVSSYDVSGDGTRLVCVTTVGKIKMFDLSEYDETSQQPTVQKVPFEPTFNYLSRFNHVRLLGNCKQVLASTVGGTLVCFDVESGDTAWSLDWKELKLKTGIRSVQVHNQYCLVTDFSNNVVLVDTSITHTDFSEKCLQRLPINNSAPVAVADFDPHDQTVVVVYANHQFLEYCPKEKRVTKFSKLAAGGKSTCPLPSAFLAKKHPTSGLVFPKKGTIIFYDIENIFSLEKSRVVQMAKDSSSDQQPPSSKSKKNNKKQAVPAPEPEKESSNKSSSPAEPLMKVTKKYQHLLFLGSLSSSGDCTSPELVAVEDKPQSLEARLPAGIRQKKFGAM